MSFTYTPGGSTNLNRVRFWIPDTDSSNAIFQDEELADLLLQQTNIKLAAADADEIIATDMAKIIKVIKVLDLEVDAVKAAEFMLKRAAVLRAQALRVIGPGAAAMAASAPYAGGISIGDMEGIEDNSDRVEPAFTVGMHDAPLGSQLVR